MRWQLVAVFFAVVAIAGWLVFQPREDAPSLVTARDHLVASDAVVATFSAGASEGYRFTSLRNGGWVWERTNGSDGSPLPDAILFTGQMYLLRISEACFIRLPTVKPPLIPGITVSRKLVNQPGLHDTAGTLFAYTIEATDFARNAAVPVSMRVTENLAGLAKSGTLLATTGEPPGLVWPGDYSLSRATPSQRQAAADLLASAKPSDYAEMVIRERIVGTTILNNAILGPFRIVIPEACPDHPTMLSMGVEGGQVEGLRSSPSPLRFLDGDPARIDDAVETLVKFRAPVDAFNAVAEAGGFGTVPVTSASVIVARIAGGGFLGLQIDSCSSRPWFRC
ncbi:MAG: hypothetical protein ABI577_01135 [bacterium]